MPRILAGRRLREVVGELDSLHFSHSHFPRPRPSLTFPHSPAPGDLLMFLPSSISHVFSNLPTVMKSATVIACFAAMTSLALPVPAVAAPPDTADVSSASDLIKDLDGSLVRAQRNGIIVTDKEGTEFTVYYPDLITSITVQADAIPAFLSQGLLVRTKVNFNAQGTPMSSVTKLEVISPVPVNAIKGHEINKYKPGVNPVDHGVKIGMPGEYYVVGQLRNMAGGFIAVQAGQVPLQLPVDPECKIEIRSHDLSIANEGDRVLVKGFYSEAKPEQIKADWIRVIPARVFGEKVEKPSRKRKAKKSEAKEAKGSGAKQAEE